MPYDPLLKQMSDSHEERISRVEDAVSGIEKQVATTTERVENFGGKLDSTFERLYEKIESYIASIHKDIELHILEDAKVASRVDKLLVINVKTDSRLDHLEEKNASSKHYWSTVKKVVWPLLAAVGAVTAEHFGRLTR